MFLFLLKRGLILKSGKKGPFELMLNSKQFKLWFDFLIWLPCQAGNGEFTHHLVVVIKWKLSWWPPMCQVQRLMLGFRDRLVIDDVGKVSWFPEFFMEVPPPRNISMLTGYNSKPKARSPTLTSYRTDSLSWYLPWRKQKLTLICRSPVVDRLQAQPPL